MVRECRPPAREPGRSWLARRSTMATSTPANISPVGPPPAITIACPVISILRPASRWLPPAHHIPRPPRRPCRTARRPTRPRAGAGLWGRSVSPREAHLSRGRNSRLTQGLLGGLGERQSGDDAGKGGGDEVEGGRDRVARGRQEGGEDQGCRPAEDGDRDAVAQRE